MRFMRKAAFAAVLGCAVILSSCGDTYRPIAYPTVPSNPDPANSTDYVMVANNNNGTGSTARSSVSIINVSGGTDIGERRLGAGVDRLFLDATLGNIMAPDSGSDAVWITAISSANGQQGSVQNRGLDPGSHPISMSPVDFSSFTASYIVNSGVLGTCSGGSVRQFDLSSHAAISQNICVGPSPVYAVLSPDQAQLFVLDSNGSVYVVNTRAETVDLANPIRVGTDPVYARLSLDGKYLYVLNKGSANISVIDVAFTSAASAVVGTISTGGTGSEYMTIDRKYQRLYVANTGSDSVSMFDVTTANTPVAIQTGIPVGSTPNSLAVLKDGSKVYVSNSGDYTVSVIDAISRSTRNGILGYWEKYKITVGATANPNDRTAAPSDTTTRVTWLTASRDGSRVFVATKVDSALKNATTIINTATDTLVKDSITSAPIFVPAPLQCDSGLGDADCTCSSTTFGQCKRMNPVFILNRPSLYDSTVETSN